jgi:hypothetical protein
MQPQKQFAWAYGDLNFFAYSNPMRWSNKKSWVETVQDITQDTSSLTQRPACVKEYIGDRETRSFNLSNMQEVQQEDRRQRGPAVAAQRPSMAVAKAMPVATATATPIQNRAPSEPAAATSTVPQPEAVKVPSTPSSFPRLDKMTVAEIQHIQDNPVALHDWLLEHPEVADLTEQARKARTDCKDLAEVLLTREADLQAATQAATFSEDHQRRVAAVVELRRKCDEITEQNSAQKLCSILASKANAAEQEGERAFEEAMAAGSVEGAALSDFRTKYFEQKVLKHKRLALKARLERS